MSILFAADLTPCRAAVHQVAMRSIQAVRTSPPRLFARAASFESIA